MIRSVIAMLCLFAGTALGAEPPKSANDLPYCQAALGALQAQRDRASNEAAGATAQAGLLAQKNAALEKENDDLKKQIDDLKKSQKK